MSKGHFKILSKKKLTDMKEGDVLTTSDYATLTPDGTFVQMEYIETDDTKEKVINHVKPGIFSMKKSMSGMYLHETAFNKDRVLDNFVETQHIETSVDNFFNKIDVYKELGIENIKRSLLITGRPGCHAKGTKILMFNGMTKNVEDVRVGDLLMGPDSKPRKVLELANGREKMLRVTPVKGESFVVNYNHIFHLTQSGQDRPFQFGLNIKGSDLVENMSDSYKERLKLTRTGVDFETKELPIDPYVFGTWLGDGHSATTRITSMDSEIVDAWREYSNKNDLTLKYVCDSGLAKTYSLTTGTSKGQVKEGRNSMLNALKELEVINNKRIPINYLTSDKKQRLELLAGIIDTDGSMSTGIFDYISSSQELANDVLYLVRSLGFACYISECTKNDQNGTNGLYYRMSISGEISEIPTRLKRKNALKREQIKDVLKTGFSLEILPEDEYFGFALSGDHLYLTNDFTIHHNTGKTTMINKTGAKYGADTKTLVLVWHTDVFEAGEVKNFVQSFEYQKYNVERMLLIVEDLGGSTLSERHGGMASDSSLLSLLDNKEKTFKTPIFILATTNNPEMFQENVVDRPERFDEVVEAPHPKAEHRVALLNFFANGHPVEPAAIELIAKPKCKEMSPAHIREVIIRSRLYDKSQVVVIEEILAHSTKYQKGGLASKRGNSGGSLGIS